MRNDGAAALIAEAPYNDFIRSYFNRNGEQPFHYISESMVDAVTGIAVAKDQLYIKDALDPLIGRLVDSGIITKMFQTPKCTIFSVLNRFLSLF